jgi:O-antigen/teichoic acid export membrane protein
LAWGDGSQDFSRLEPGYWKEHWNYSRWALASAIVLQLNTQGYYWLVAGFLSVKDVADLRAMYLLVAPTENIFVAISFIILPAMAAHHAANRMPALLGTWKLNALAVVGITGLFAIAVRLFGKTLIHVVYAGKFDGLAPLLYLLVLSPMLVGIAGTMINALKAVERPKTVCYAYGCSGVVTFLVAVPLVHKFGLRGAVYGMLVSGASLVIALGVLFMIYIYKGSRANVSRVRVAETHIL